MGAVKALKQSGGKIKEMVSTDVIPISNLATGTPDGTKFIRDDGTLFTAMTRGQVLAIHRGLATQF